MKKKYLKRKILPIITSLLLVAGILNSVSAQELRWLRVGQLQCYFMDYGSECEYTAFQNNSLTWPTQYGDNQYMARAKALWLGCKNFYDPVEKKDKGVKVVGSGPRYDPVNQQLMVFPQSIQLIGKTFPPLVTVDDQIGTNNTLYDVLDDVKDNLPCDRMIVIKFNTSMGVSVTKKVMAFTQQNHDNYFIYDYVFKNTGIYNQAGDKYEQTLQEFWIYFNYRYGFSGVTSSGYGSTWGAFASEWGVSTEFQDFGPYRPYKGSDMRGFFGFYGPCKDRQAQGVSLYDQDWGCPNQLVDGLLGSAKYAGAVTLFASKSTQQWSVDDPEQPRNTAYVACDNNPQLIMNATVSQYDELFMGERYRVMTEGHLPQSHTEALGGKYTEDWSSQHPDRDGGGGTSQGQGFGPYTLAPGDSIHIVFAEGANGINWEKCREVGANWFAYFKGNGTPALIMPDGSQSNSYTEYTKVWVQTGIDSILQTFRNAIANYNSGYNIPQPPPAPQNFTVSSGGDRIKLTWAGNASSWPYFNGYVIYRSEGNVKDYRTKYKKIFECNKSNAVTEFDDITAARGFNYYYYIQSKDDGSQNDVRPGEPLYSSLFLTITSVPAYLRRPAAPEVPIPPINDTTYWKPLMQSKGLWIAGSDYIERDVITYNNSDFYCFASITKDTISPDQNSTYWKLITYKGNWISGSGYNDFDAVTYQGVEYITPYGISAGQGLDLVRVVPNPYDIRARLFQFGDQSQYDRLAFYGLPPQCKLKIFTERGDLIWEKDHTSGSGDELWDSVTSSNQIVVSGIYILYVEAPDGRKVIRKFVVIR